jgi:hypothetical protein
VSRFRPLAAVAALLIPIVALAGCGLPEDKQPRPITGDLADQLNEGGVGENVGTALPGTEWIVYVVETDPTTGEQRLAEFPGAARGSLTPGALIQQLLDTREETLRPSGNPNLSNQIPGGTKLIEGCGVTADGTTAVITLSDEFGDVQGPAQILALAQLVYTATETGEFSDVQFRVGSTCDNAQAQDVVAGNGELMSTVEREDYIDQQPEVSD